jgi:hypothetical protein
MVEEDGGGSNQTNQPVVGNYCSASGRIIMVLAGMEPTTTVCCGAKPTIAKGKPLLLHQGFHNVSKSSNVSKIKSLNRLS